VCKSCLGGEEGFEKAKVAAKLPKGSPVDDADYEDRMLEAYVGKADKYNWYKTSSTGLLFGSFASTFAFSKPSSPPRHDLHTPSIISIEETTFPHSLHIAILILFNYYITILYRCYICNSYKEINIIDREILMDEDVLGTIVMLLLFLVVILGLVFDTSWAQILP